MRGLEDIVKENREAERLGFDIGGVGTKQDAERFPRDPLDPSSPTVADLQQQVAALETELLNQPKPRRLNVLQFTFVHDVGQRVITGTSTTPYLEEPNDPAIIALRNLLLKRFEEITEPGRAAATIWGEGTVFPGDPEVPEIRTPSERPLQLLKP